MMFTGPTDFMSSKRARAKKEVLYLPLRNTAEDPTYISWHTIIGYDIATFVPYDGIYFTEPVSSFSYMLYGSSVNDPDMATWDVSGITDFFSFLFGNRSFNQPLNSWDVSNVTRMESAFRDVRAFNQPLNNWDVSNVTNMNRMFNNARAFDQDISNWCVSNISEKPNSFDNNTIVWQEAHKPVWGTCPA